MVVLPELGSRRLPLEQLSQFTAESSHVVHVSSQLLHSDVSLSVKKPLEQVFTQEVPSRNFEPWQVKQLLLNAPSQVAQSSWHSLSRRVK